jgi:hypothetical protein
MNVDMPREASAEGVHDHHEAWQIIVFVVIDVGVPISQRLIHNAVEAIKVSASANPEVVKKLMRRSKDHMLVLAVCKQAGVARNRD